MCNYYFRNVFHMYVLYEAYTYILQYKVYIDMNTTGSTSYTVRNIAKIEAERKY